MDDLKVGRWNEDEEFLLANHEKLTYIDIAEKLGRKYHSVLHQALKLGLRKRNAWTVQDNQLIFDLFPNAPKEEILDKMDRTWGAIIKRAAELKVRRGALLPPLEKTVHLSLSEKDKVWVACAIDCEGSLGVALTKRGFYNPFISINNTKRELVQHFRTLIGCLNKHIQLVTRKEIDPRKNVYAFHLGSASLIYHLLCQIRPYLIIKGQQADLVIEFIESIDAMKKQNGGRISYTERHHEIYQELKALNRKGKE